MIVGRQFNDIMKVMPRSSYILLSTGTANGHCVLDLKQISHKFYISNT